MTHQDKNIYRINGLSCHNCAAKFEKNVQQLPNVNSASVNFGAATITIDGTASIKELELAGAFDNLSFHSSNEKKAPKLTIKNWLTHHLPIFFSMFFILIALITPLFNPNTSIFTTLCYISAICIGGIELFKEGLKDLIHLNFSMQLLMTISIIGASLIGQWKEGAIVVILFAISEALESYSMDKARQSIRSLVDLAPRQALIRRDSQEQLIHVDDILVGDIMIVKPGEKIAMDGNVIKGGSSVNQATITGESLPVEKQVNDLVYAGTLNEEGLLEIQVSKKSTDTTLAKIIYLIEEAQGKKAPAQSFVDTFAKVYTPIIMLLSGLVMVIPPLLFNGDWNTWLYQGLSLLVVGCPCSLVISTPVSIVSSLGNAAKNGVLIKGGIYLEALGEIETIAFDKTGTLTKGKPNLTNIILVEDTHMSEDVLIKVAAIESLSHHPLSTAITNEATNLNLNYHALEVQHFSSITGKGLVGDINQVTYYIGNPSLFNGLLTKELMALYKNQQSQGQTVVLFGTSHQIIALLTMADEMRESSVTMLKNLHNMGIKHSVMLTGDADKTAQHIGQTLGISDIKSNLLPQDKLTCVAEMTEQYGKVAMVGDGVNDSPALAAATVGIAMGLSGSDTALETADVVLMGDDLQVLPGVINLGRSTRKIIKQNITFSLIIKLLALLLVIPGWLTLWIAIIADMGATLIVTLNGIRLARIRIK